MLQIVKIDKILIRKYYQSFTLLRMMKSLFRKAFGIYPNEKKMVFRFVRLAIFWSTASALAETLSLGLFLEKIGTENLPLIFLIIAVGMIGVSTLFLYLLKIFSPEKIFMSVLSVAAFFYSLIACILTTESGFWIWIVLQIFTTIFTAAMITSFWNLLDQYHDLQEAKRIYGIYTAAYFMGSMMAGILVNQVMKITGPVTLFSLVFLLCILSVIEIYSISKTISPIEDTSGDGLFIGEKKKISTTLRLFYKSPFALFLVLAGLIVQLLKTTTEFNYMTTFQASFQASNANSLPEFLGKLKAFVGFANIIFSLFFYRRFVKKLGLGQIILFPSIFFFFVYTEWSLFDSLLLAIFGFIALEAILFNLNDNNNNLLINATPSKLKGSLRVINDSFFEPIGLFIGSLFLLVLQKPYSIYFGLVLAFVFFILYAFLSTLYPKSIFINLKQNLIHFERKVKDWLTVASKNEQKELKEDIFQALENPSEEIRLLAFESLLATQDPSLVNKMLFHVDTLSENAKMALLKLFDQSSYAQDPKILEKVNEWLDADSHKDIGKWSHFYLAKRGLLHPEKVKDDLDNPDLLLRVSAIITLKNSLVNSILPSAALNRTIALKELELLLKSTHEAELCMGIEILSVEKGLESFTKALPFLSHDSIKVQRSAAKTLALLSDKKSSRYAYKILEELKASPDNQFRLHCIEILGKMNDSTIVPEILLASITFKPNEKRCAESLVAKMGLKTVPILISFIRNTQFHDRSRILAAKILGNLA
ncbi:MAG: MFS transporter, partial [Chlamydiota bacterium]